uniref:Peptidase M12A domain-containing protein n=1 Tax=Steinernema glaseri TaxID=37863 RepID=A0A1I7Y9K4_9BILA
MPTFPLQEEHFPTANTNNITIEKPFQGFVIRPNDIRPSPEGHSAMSIAWNMVCLLLLLLVSPSLAVVKRNAIDNELEPEKLWPTDRPIFYTFSANFSEADI